MRRYGQSSQKNSKAFCLFIKIPTESKNKAWIFDKMETTLEFIGGKWERNLPKEKYILENKNNNFFRSLGYL